MTYPTQLLPSVEHIKALLPPSLADMTVFVYDTIDSTNTQARRHLQQGISAPHLVVAHQQTDGRGRLGRSFHSPQGSGLYMTLVFDSSAPLERLTSVTPVAAVATAEAISQVCGKEVSVKWVNDLYLEGKKVCGILTEAVTFAGGHHIMVGIGINITTRDFPKGMRNPAGAVLGDNDPPVDQSRLCACIVQRFMESVSPEKAANCLASYRKRLCFTGERVICTRHFPADSEPLPPDSMEGIVMGVDEDYGLILALDNGTAEVLRGGEISIKPKL